MSDSFYSCNNVSVVDEIDTCDREISHELSKYPYKIKVFGLDCEWVTHREGSNVSVCPVALLQLAFPHSKCYLIRLCCMDGRLPDTLRRILEDRSCLKVGVGIAEDSKKLSTRYGLVVQGCIDLRHVASRCRAYVQHCFNEGGPRHGMSLSSLSQQILGVALDKDWKIRCSNWEAETLSERQVEYAANDAIVAERIFFMLALSKLKEKEERLESGRDGTSGDGVVECSDGLDVSGGCGDDDDDDDSPGLISGSCEETTTTVSPAAHSFADMSLREDVVKQLTTGSEADVLNRESTQCGVELGVSENKNKCHITEIEGFSNEGDGMRRTNHDECGHLNPKIANIGETLSESNENGRGSEGDTSKLLCDDVKITSECDTQTVEQLDTSMREEIPKSSDNLTVISGLLQQLSTFSLGFFTQFPSKRDSAETKSLAKTKMYSQYPSFECLKLTTESLDDGELWDIVIPLTQGIVDVPFKAKQKNRASDSGKTGPTGSQQPVKRSSLKPRCAPLYQNCVIEAPDGEMLSTCDRRKAGWYLVRDLADVVSEEPYTIRLRFEPAGRPIDPEHNYYLTFKENMCVVCGRDDCYMRKNVIPHDYRKHFPPCMKNHHSHDVLLLCPPCHMISCNHDDMLRKRLEKKYRAPLASSQVARLIQDPALTKVKSAAKALVYGGDKIPAWRRQELLSLVEDFLGDEDPSLERLTETAAMEIRRKNCDFVSHGREVVRKVKEDGELLAFEKMWREHFLATMQPRFLPPLWTVDHEQDKVKGRLEQELEQERENDSAVVT